MSQFSFKPEEAPEMSQEVAVIDLGTFCFEDMEPVMALTDAEVIEKLYAEVKELRIKAAGLEAVERLLRARIHELEPPRVGVHGPGRHDPRKK